jgi:hypothetical protein
MGKMQEKDDTSSSGSSLTPKSTVVPEDDEPLISNFGRMHLHRHESSYTECDHWTAVLDEISDLKQMVSVQQDDIDNENRNHTQPLPGTDLFLSQTYPADKMEIIAALPSRVSLDSLIAKYFELYADMPVALVIHRGVFFKQYESFWEDPMSTPIMFITILFGMTFMVAFCTLFVTGVDQLDEETLAEYHKIVAVSRTKMIHCLKLGNYMKGTPHTIEALLSLMQVEYMQGQDVQQGCWQLIGVIVRVALKMGYHRDGSHFPQMSAFEAEMRRRTWYILTQFDTASASQVGLPRIIKQSQCDTAEPRNLLDEDFDDTTVVLPSPRPGTEHTLSQFLVYKSRVIKVYGEICDFTTSSAQRDYAEVMRLDTLLNAAYTQKPRVLELKPMHRSIMDGADLITRRLFITISFHHARMTLHRKFMVPAKTNCKYTFSHTTCIDSALTVLQLQADLWGQCKPGRMLHANRWKVLLLIQSELLLATTILCFNLNDDYSNVRCENASLAQDQGFEKMLAALRDSQAIWKQQEAGSKEAQTAVKAIEFVLAKARSKNEKWTKDFGSQSSLDIGSLHTPSKITATEAYSTAYLKGGDATTIPYEPGFDSTSFTTSDFIAQQEDNDGGSYSELFGMDWSWDACFDFGE